MSLVRVQSRTLLLFSNKLVVSYVLSNLTFSFVKSSGASQRLKTTYVVIPVEVLGYLAIHLKLSSVFYSSQLVDMFAYEALYLHPAGVWGGSYTNPKE